jgi:hypothetical protein
MRQHLEDLAIALSLAAVYFGSVAFAVAAIWQPWAIQAGMIAAMLVLLVYLGLVLTVVERDWLRFMVALLFALATSCIAAGAVWWVVVRGLGLWRLRP